MRETFTPLHSEGGSGSREEVYAFRKDDGDENRPPPHLTRLVLLVCGSPYSQAHLSFQASPPSCFLCSCRPQGLLPMSSLRAPPQAQNAFLCIAVPRPSCLQGLAVVLFHSFILHPSIRILTTEGEQAEQIPPARKLDYGVEEPVASRDPESPDIRRQHLPPLLTLQERPEHCREAASTLNRR